MRPMLDAPAAQRRRHTWMRQAGVCVGVALTVAAGARTDAQAVQDRATAAAATAAPTAPRATTAPSPGYVIGADDVLSILFWRDKDLSAPEVTVRPDGKVTLPLLNDLQAAGLTPDQLRDAIAEAARKYVEDPNPTVIVKEIKSRKVFITGQVEKAGPYPLNGATSILQLIATAGGLRDFADGKNISLMRTENGKPVVYEFNYQDVLKKKNLRQNIELKPGDVVVVP
jgi:polysaccharide export outer membrane protein